jgi:hypothetical protein
MPSVTRSCTRLPNNTLCSTCGKVFKNSKGLTRHKTIIQKYNQNQELDELPFNTVAEFKQIIVSEIHKKLSLNFRAMGKKSIVIACPESLFFSIFTGNIHYYSKKKKIYRCIFRGSNAYQELSEVLNSNQWGKKAYSQNQETYVVCLDPVPWNSNNSNSQLDDDVDPLEQSLQSSIKNHKSKTTKKRRPRFLRGEILIEWKRRVSREINGVINTAGYMYINFYIAQSQNLSIV